MAELLTSCGQRAPLSSLHVYVSPPGELGWAHFALYPDCCKEFSDG